MGRGYLFGLLVGALVAALGLGGVSLMVPVGGTGAGGAGGTVADADSSTAPGSVAESAAAPEAGSGPAAETVAEAAPEPAPEAAPAPQPAAAPETAPQPAPAAPEAGVGTAAAEPGVETPGPATSAPQTSAPQTSIPQTSVVEVPPGSEFNRPKPETDPAVPAPEPEPATAPLPQVAAPAAEIAPAVSGGSPPGVPETAPAPAAPEPPESVAPPAIASAPAAEAAIPVPPAGTAAAPSLGTGETAEAPLPPAAVGAAPAPVAAADPAALPEAVPAPAQPGTAPAEPDAAPEAGPEAGPLSEPAPEPAEVAEPAPPASDLPATLDDAPVPPQEEMPAQDGGPIIIGSAPDAPKTGFGQTMQPGFGGPIKPGFGQAVPGVKINRLPTIGAETPAAEPEFVPAPGEPPVAQPAPGASPGASLGEPPAGPQEDTALRRYAATFDNPEQKPLVAVVLVDIGEAKGGVAPDAIAALGRPVTVAIDPAEAAAGARASVYRLGGDEIAILASDLPDAATPSDLEVSYQGMAGALPEAVAVVGRPDSLFQTDRRVAQHLVSLLASEGRGLVTFTGGLNPAGQAAEGEGLPHAAVFRDLDAEGENPATIIRYLDRAAFEAARSGAVVVLGTTAPETVAALEEWIAGGARGVAVGPVSAAMLGN